MTNEIWKDVPGYSGLYQVSTTGRIRAYSKIRGTVRLKARILKPRVNRHGYFQITLINETGRKTFSLHQPTDSYTQK